MVRSGDGAQKKVLVVDDEFAIVEALSTLLTDEGYAVQTAVNGREGLERLREDKPDVVLLDVMMPILDGRAMLKQMRDDTHLVDVPVILMSAASKANLGPEGGPSVQAFLKKPFGVAMLLETIERVLGGGLVPTAT